jgi:hypothetical protein
MEEYPAACLSVLLAARSAAPLDAFFSSPTFHACVQQGATLALAFGEYLMGLGADWAPRRASRQGAARLEHAIAAARRSAASVANGGQPDGVGAGDRVAAPEVLPVRLRLAPGVAVVAAPAGTLAVKQAVTAALTTPVGARPGAVSDTIVELAAAGLELPELAEGDDEQLLIHAQAEAGGPAIVERIPAELARVLAAAARDVDRSVLLELLRAEGAAAGEDADVLRSLLGDKVLVAVAPDTQPAG